MRTTSYEIPGLILAEPDVHRDQRGYFLETYQRARYAEAGIAAEFVQDNQSSSVRDTLRGLHAQLTGPQGKLIRCIRGAVYDVAVDARPRSPAFGRWIGVRLTGEDHRQFYIPPGCLHGFVVLSDRAEVAYKCTSYYDPEDEIGVAWNDPDIGIDWPCKKPLLSPKDAGFPSFRSQSGKWDAYRDLA